jgi:maleylpyruvate isomerase
MPDFSWMDAGTAYFAARLDGADLHAASALPGWTRRHVVAHVAANARGLGRLAHWAATGEETPMYPSAQARDAEIEELATLPPEALVTLAEETAADLRAALLGLSGPQWEAQVRTSQGKMVPASEIVWMRCREMWIHGVDLGTGGGFADFPPDLLDALLADVAKLWERRGEELAPVLITTDTEATFRSGDAQGHEVYGTAAELAAWVTGRGPAPHPGAPAIGGWL